VWNTLLEVAGPSRSASAGCNGRADRRQPSASNEGASCFSIIGPKRRRARPSMVKYCVSRGPATGRAKGQLRPIPAGPRTFTSLSPPMLAPPSLGNRAATFQKSRALFQSYERARQTSWSGGTIS